MREQIKNLTQYVFGDDHEEIADGDRLVSVRTDSGADYLPLKGGFRRRYVRGSTPDIYSRKFSRKPQVGELLVTSLFLSLDQRISDSKIREIREDFCLPEIQTII
jgi:hypothetical protein